MNITADGIIHYSHWASQPTVLIACGLEADTWTVLYPEKETPYYSAEARGYTFDESKVTCPVCIEYIKIMEVNP